MKIAIKSFTFLLLSLFILSCSSGIEQNKRTENRTNAGTDVDDELFGGLEFPPEGTLTNYLTANVDNTRVRCEYDDSDAANVLLKCFLVVVQYDGSELRPTGIDSKLKITWNDLENSSGGSVGACSPSTDKLTADCTITDTANSVLAQNLLAVTKVSLSDGEKSAVTSETTKLTIKIGVVAGLVPSIPVQYKSDASIFSPMPMGLNLAGGSVDVGFQPISELLANQKVVNDRGIGFINSACIREKKIYFSTGLNVFWIKDWTSSNAQIQVYSGASAVDRLFKSGGDADHRLWIPYKGDQMVYCAPGGAVVVDNNQGRIWRLWDDGRAKLIAGTGVHKGKACESSDKYIAGNGFLTSANASSKKASETNLACIGGLDIVPGTDEVYFVHHAHKTAFPEIYRADYKTDSVEFLMKINSEHKNVGFFDDGIFKGSQNLFRTRNRTRSPAFRLLENSEFLVSDELDIIKGNLKEKTFSYLNKSFNSGGAELSAFGNSRGFYYQGSTLFTGTEVGIQKVTKVTSSGEKSEGQYISNDYIGSGITAATIRTSTQNRYLGTDKNISGVNLHAVQSVEQNRHPDYDDIVIAEWDAIRLLQKDGTLKTIISRAHLTEPTTCLEEISSKDALMPFISDLARDDNGDIFISTSGVASPNGDKETGAVDSEEYVTYYDYLKLFPGGDSTLLASYSKCFAGRLRVDNTVVNRLGDRNVDNSSSNLSSTADEQEGIALRQDWYSAFIKDTTNSISYMYMASGHKLYEKVNSTEATEITKTTTTAVADHTDFLGSDGQNIGMKNSSMTEADFSTDQYLTLYDAFSGKQSEEADLLLSKFYIETPISAMTAIDSKLFILTGLIQLDTNVLSMLKDGEKISNLLTGDGDLAGLVNSMTTGYKIVEYDRTTGNTKIVYHSFPKSEGVDGDGKLINEKKYFDKVDLDILGNKIYIDIKTEDVWDDAWQLGRGGIDAVVKSAGVYKIYVTAPFLFGVDEYEYDSATTFDMQDGTNNTVQPKRIIGKEIPLGSKVVQEYPNGKPALDHVLWNPWDLAVSDNGDIIVAEAMGGGVKRFSSADGTNWTVNTVFGGYESSQNCMAGDIEVNADASASFDGVLNQSSSMLCKGDIWAVEAKDNCGSGDEKEEIKIYLSQNFLTASNVIELIRPCD